MKAFIISQLIFIVFLTMSFDGFAVEVDNLYRGKILVTDKTLKTRVKAHRWAIEQVFAKVTGNREVLQNKRIQFVVRNRAANYIKSFTFVTDEQERTFLVDEFDQTKINKLLRDVGASIWGKRRPQTLIWLAIEENLSRNIVHQENFPQLSEFIYRSAEDRGLPVVLPAMDEKDRSAVFVSDVWARFEGPVAQASERYAVENYVLARMRYLANDPNAPEQSNEKSGWLVQYQLMHQQNVLLKGEVGGEQFTALKDMVNHITDYYASQYAIKSESLATDKLDIEITELGDVVALVQAEKLLLALAPVADIQLKHYAQSKAQFSMQLSGEALDVIKALSLQPEFDEVLQLEVDQPQVQLTNEQRLNKLTSDYLSEGRGETVNDELPQESAQPVMLRYRWQGR